MGQSGYIHPAIAAILDRPDLAYSNRNVFAPEVPIDPYPRIANQKQTAGLAFSVEGRAAAGGLMLAILALAGFYIWTRGHQV